MLGVTIFGVIFTPVFFYVIRKWTTDKPKPAVESHPTPPANSAAI
jgi:hypothetical protein